MDGIIQEVLDSVRQSNRVADRIGISNAENELMSGAFKV